MFDQFKIAADMMKGMSPEQIKQLMEQAKNSQQMIDDQIRKVADEEIKKRDLISRKEALEMLSKSNCVTRK